ncbi:MAG: hypothetical protein P1U86_13790 [Verrucomicrobiales bacterium]|nr:hypothetical protein [Verrucomicrobiales bacterium]
MSSTELRPLLEADPGSWSLRQALVEALVAEGQHDAAVEVVNAGEAIPREPQPWVDAAKAYAAVGALEQARGLIAGSLEIDPEYAPALEYQKTIEAAVAATPVALTADDVDADENLSTDSGASAVPVIAVGSADGNDPIALPQVSFSSTEMDAIHAAEEEARRIREKTIGRDKMNSILITVVVHVAIIALLTFVATKTPPRVPPQIVASSAPPTQEEVIENVKMDKPTVEPTSVNSAVADIISVSATSSFSVSNVDVQVSNMAVETGVAFNPSMSLGMPTSTESKMMFGQEMEGEVLGVILDVSGSMAEFLPAVVREVDKNFKDAPIVYVRNMLIRDDNRKESGEVRLIVPEDVIPYYKDETNRNVRSPYWFLWHDLPRKAPQRYVDRLIDTFKERPNQFLSVGRWEQSSTDAAVDFLMEQGIDSLYIFSDYEDFVDEDIALEIGQKLGRRKIRTYLQPAEAGSDFLDIMTKKIANRTLGRRMPSLVSLLNGKLDEQPTSLTMQKPEEDTTLADLDINLATPRPEPVGLEWYADKPSEKLVEIHRLSEPEYDAVFYGPEARVYIYLKDDNGQYIQNPIKFFYHSWKTIPDHPDPRYRTRRRAFLRNAEEPSFDGKEIVWKMILEDELKFDVHLYLGRKGMNATYVADNPTDGTNDSAHIYFSVPALAREREDRYYGFDFPEDGLKLDHVREANKENVVIMNLPRQFRDRFAKNWSQSGFEMGENTRHFNELIRRLPAGIREMEVKGPSFGPRIYKARTTSNKILLNGGAGRADIEPWEGFYASLARSRDTREKFTKTEAIEIEIK